MFGYYFHLAVRSFRRNKVLTALMVLAIALGIGASMTTLTVFYVLSGDPIPQKSDRLFYVQVDAEPKSGYQPGDEPDYQSTRFDAEALLREKRAMRQAMMSGGSVAIEPQRSGLSPFKLNARFTSADFFAMFDVPLLYGQAWSGTSDERHERVAVISKSLNEKLFDGGNSVGREVRVDKNTFRIVGVLDTWKIDPRFYDITDTYGANEQLYVPFSTAMDLKLSHSGGTNCSGKVEAGDTTALNAPCNWVQYWVELGNAKQAGDYKVYLENYSDQQRAAGRFTRPNNVRLRNVMQWLDYNKVVPSDVRLQLWLAMGGPARMADAQGGAELFGLRGLRHLGHPPGATHPAHLRAVEHCNAGGIVAAVFQALESLDQDRDHIAPGDRSDNAAHKTALAKEVAHFSVSALVRCMTVPGQRVRHQCPRTLRTLVITP